MNLPSKIIYGALFLSYSPITRETLPKNYYFWANFTSVLGEIYSGTRMYTKKILGHLVLKLEVKKQNVRLD